MNKSGLWDLLAFVFLLPFGEFLAGLVGYVLVSVFSLGQARGQEPKDKIAFPWHGFARAPDGHLVVQDSVASLIGAMFLLSCIFTFIAWRVGAFRA